jgi:hypothetical protein
MARSLFNMYERFGGTFYPHLQGCYSQNGGPGFFEMLPPVSTELHGVTSQKNACHQITQL